MAVSGTRIERKAIVSRISARPTTTARYGTRLSAIRWETSMLVAVWPVTSTSEVCARIVLTRFSVWVDDGPLDGITEISARSGLICWAGETAATSGSLASALTVASASPVATIVSWPLTPTPKPSDTRSYAWRCVVSGLAVPSLGRPRRTSSAGMASAPRAITTVAAAISGRRMTRPIQRAPSVLRSSAAKVLPRVIRVPAKPSRAGTSVRLSSTATATAPAAAKPICARNGTPVTASATRAMITVEPANTTALPAVPTASAIDSGMLMPSRTCVRWRERMKSA